MNELIRLSFLDEDLFETDVITGNDTWDWHVKNRLVYAKLVDGKKVFNLNFNFDCPYKASIILNQRELIGKSYGLGMYTPIKVPFENRFILVLESDVRLRQKNIHYSQPTNAPQGLTLPTNHHIITNYTIDKITEHQLIKDEKVTLI